MITTIAAPGIDELNHTSPNRTEDDPAHLAVVPASIDPLDRQLGEDLGGELERHPAPLGSGRLRLVPLEPVLDVRPRHAPSM